MINIGSKRFSKPGWRQSNSLSPAVLESNYGKDAVQCFNSDIPYSFVFSESKKASDSKHLGPSI